VSTSSFYPSMGLQRVTLVVCVGAAHFVSVFAQRLLEAQGLKCGMCCVSAGRSCCARDFK
jgi:hypothetical protein